MSIEFSFAFIMCFSRFCFVFFCRECAKLMVSLHSAAPQSKLRAVYKKFCSTDGGAVALLSAAKNLQ
ncbi:hypothetical protein L6164_029220 [Bauhinia variegata]|uniref:Uncharacterized protein n=1 Tax=Bauhinia variegata TaxID=167791 RepID=A0ACB9L8X5_BAUVA|nr:hypothetical protein L6164_029220 [Bauhinia variegata]